MKILVSLLAVSFYALGCASSQNRSKKSTEPETSSQIVQKRVVEEPIVKEKTYKLGKLRHSDGEFESAQQMFAIYYDESASALEELKEGEIFQGINPAISDSLRELEALKNSLKVTGENPSENAAEYRRGLESLILALQKLEAEESFDSKQRRGFRNLRRNLEKDMRRYRRLYAL